MSRRENQPPLWRRALDGFQKNCYTASGDEERIVLEFVAVGGERKAVLLGTVKGGGGVRKRESKTLKKFYFYCEWVKKEVYCICIVK